MLNQPTSSPMMTRMLGFCCAAAGTLAAIKHASNASGPSLRSLLMLMDFLPGRGRRKQRPLAPDHDCVQLPTSSSIDDENVRLLVLCVGGALLSRSQMSRADGR